MSFKENMCAKSEDWGREGGVLRSEQSSENSVFYRLFQAPNVSIWSFGNSPILPIFSVNVTIQTLSQVLLLLIPVCCIATLTLNIFNQ